MPLILADYLQFNDITLEWEEYRLSTDWSLVDNKPTTLAGYGITDAYNNYVDALSFNTSDGVLTLGRNGSLDDLTVDLDGRYAELAGAVFSGMVALTDVVINGTVGSDSGHILFGGQDYIDFDTALLNNVGTPVLAHQAANKGYVDSETVLTKAWVEAKGYITDASDDNNYADSLAFNTSNGIITVGRNGSLGDLTVDIDGRYIEYNDVIMPTNPFGGKKVYINSIDNALYAADKKWVVVATRHLKSYGGNTYPMINPAWVSEYTLSGGGTTYTITNTPKPPTIVVYDGTTLKYETTHYTYNSSTGVITFNYSPTTPHVYGGAEITQYLDSPVNATLNGSSFFDGSYETTQSTASLDYYIKVRITPRGNYYDTFGTEIGYSYGSFYLSYYYAGTPEKNSDYRVYNYSYQPHGIGWKQLATSDYIGSIASSSYVQKVYDGGNHGRSIIEFIIYGKAPHSGTYQTSPSQIEWQLDRPNLSKTGATVTKYGENKLYSKLYLGNQTDNKITLDPAGIITALNIKVGSYDVWNAGNLDPTDYALLTGAVFSGMVALTDVVINGTVGSDSGHILFGGQDYIDFDTALLNNVGTPVLAHQAANKGYVDSETVLTKAWVVAQGYLVDSVDDNNYVDSLAFNTADGILTVGRNGVLADLTVDLDGRYQIALSAGTQAEITTGTETAQRTWSPIILKAAIQALSDLDTDTNNYVDSLAFNTADGILTIGRNGSLIDLTVDLDGRYAELAGAVFSGMVALTDVVINGTVGSDSGHILFGGQDYIDFGGAALNNVLTPVLNHQAANKNYVDNLVDDYLLLTGGRITGNVTIGADTTNLANIIFNVSNAGSPQITFTDHFGDMTWAIGGDDGDNNFKIHGNANSTEPIINNLVVPLFELTTAGQCYLSGNEVWHAGNLDPTDYVLLTGGIFTGMVTVPSLVINGTVGSDSGHITFGGQDYIDFDGAVLNNVGGIATTSIEVNGNVVWDEGNFDKTAAIPSIVVADAKTISYTFVASDMNKFIWVNSASSLTMTISSVASFAVGTEIHVARYGAGEVTIGYSGVNLMSEGSKRRINAQYQVVTLKKISSSTWMLFGALKT